MAHLRRVRGAMVRAICGVKLMDNKKTDELMDMFGLKESVAKLAKANRMQWYGHVLRRQDDLSRKVFTLKVGDGEREEDPRKLGKSKWKKK